MKYLQILISIVLFYSCSSCSQNKQKKITNKYKLPLRIQYINNPKPNDTICIRDIIRAKEDVKNGNIVFTKKAGLNQNHLRYETELKELCKQYGLVFKFELLSCVIDSQTEGCYADYMDQIIFEKYGIDFKKKLFKQADSIFIDNALNKNKIVVYHDCDEKPRLPTTKIGRTVYSLKSIAIDNLNLKEKKGEFGGWPFFDISFIIEKDSTISEFQSYRFVPKLEVNEKYEKALYKIAVKHIKSNYPIWIPGKINGLPVRTENTVRISIEKK